MDSDFKKNDGNINFNHTGGGERVVPMYQEPTKNNPAIPNEQKKLYYNILYTYK